MRFDNFLGGSYQSQAYTANQEHTINWYPEKVEPAGASGQYILLPSPGVETVGVFYDGVGRGHLSMDGREFIIVGDRMYELYEDGTSINRNVVHSSDRATTPITIDSNGDLGSQLLIVSDEGAYSYDLTGGVSVAAIAALTGKATMGGYLDGYGLCLDADTSTLYVSALGDFTSWTTGTDFAQRSLAADPWKSMKVSGRYIWMFGEYTTEIWQDTGERFPLAPIPSALIDWGISAQYSAAVVGNNVCWLGQHKNGRVAVVRGGGVNPQVISNPALEYRISQYSDPGGARGDSYSWNGHTFYLLHFDADNITWVWDEATNLWHQRGTWDEASATWRAWSLRHFATAYGEVRALDRMITTDPSVVDSAATSSFVYRLSDTFPVDVDGAPIRRVRQCAPLVKDDKRMFYPEFELLMDVGESVDQETAATVALTAQTAAVAETTMYTMGTEAQTYVVSCDLSVTTETADYSVNASVYWYVGGVQKTHFFGQITEEGVSVGGYVTAGRILSEKIIISPDPGTVVSYVTGYASTPAGMEYSLDMSLYVPGVEDPQVMLRMSDDAGKTWGREHWASAGKTGEYPTRVHWHRLGAGRRRLFEVAVSDPIPWKLTNAFIEVSEGNS